MLLAIAVPIVFASGNARDKMEAEELAAKHVASIGTEEARKNISSITIAGTTKAVFKGRGTGETSGLVVLASQGRKNLIGMKFPTPDYPHERMGYDGDDFSVAFVVPGQRSELGEFMKTNDKTFKTGILGGALSSSWELLRYDEERGKLSSCKTTDINDVEVYRCRYKPDSGSDLKIEMFFDAATFRHVRTEYSRVISARQGTSIDNSARQQEERYQLVEEFGDFAEESGLTLPHTYTIKYEKQTGEGTRIYTWTMNLQQFQFNNEIDPKEFKVDSY
ncbi:MAG: hypothetical protein DWQ47_13870 [Acidobacteria bacterium]|nr:MAG: hypothetical protein DWQ32_01270 [Acidobacteriota bacterium]REK02841.1 MAG: hypothetical protein DWQ38_10865 [Acidobacteriota bacterium]REK13355.1 MAG: hypothetical protein DWQ43_06960 [Acidobacteriota bacterium]REK41349.1 MAG: hypothetical protein DWQ47_13870 [Acidobacteriota bacterium]